MKNFTKSKRFQLFIAFLLLPIYLVSAGGDPVYTITSGGTTLSVRSYGENNYGVGLQLGDTFYEQATPCALEVVTNDGSANWQMGGYFSAEELDNNTYRCVGIQTSYNGSVFTFTDTYSLHSSGYFEVDRNVVVNSAAEEDDGFSTRLTFARTVTSNMSDYDFFAPGIWYKNNANVNDVALATDLTDYYYWFREDRMPLPMFMLRDKNTGAAFSVCHKDPDGSTFTGEDGLTRIIDDRMKFASIGMQNNTQPSVGILYPGSEGERTGIWGMSSNNNRWAYRNHPVRQGYAQDYSMAMRLYYEPDFPTAMKNAWSAFYDMFNPTLYECNLNQIYLDQIGLLDHYWKSINGSAGFPFRVHLDGTADENDYNWNMGFVGQQIPNAAILLREGIDADNQQMVSKSLQTIDWWADNALTSNGCPRTWYDPYPQSWRSYPTYTRVVGDGMRGMIWAWNFRKQQGVNEVSWLNTCYRVANWLASQQNGDGSFPRAWDYNNDEVVHPEKTNTSHVIPFLVDMFKATGNQIFKNAALEAGNYVYVTNYENFDYVGGTPDNPNVPDKEAASMALRAFLALYDTDGDAKWLEAAKQTAYYYETWVYSWNVPIPSDDPSATYPRDRGTTGLSIIATANNGADTYAAIDAFNFYRMYLYTNDAHLLDMARLLLKNTKQAVNWDRDDPINGYGRYGILDEAMTVMIPRGHGVGYYLPWQTYNLVEPMVLLRDVFGGDAYDISTINEKPDIVARHDAYSETRNFTSSESESVEVGQTYLIVSRNSGKVLEVVDSSSDNGANIQQGTCNRTSKQFWTLEDAGNGYFKMVVESSGKCADVEGSSIGDGANISQSTDMGADNQLWSIVDVGGGYWKIVNKNSGKVMDVVNFSTNDNANVTQYHDAGTANQQWLFVKVDPATATHSKEQLSLNSNMEVYPNPVDDVVYIRINDLSYHLAGIYDLKGQLWMDLRGNDKRSGVNVSGLPVGAYFMRILMNDRYENLMFLKK
jgi:hypothetical protein